VGCTLIYLDCFRLRRLVCLDLFPPTVVRSSVNPSLRIAVLCCTRVAGRISYCYSLSIGSGSIVFGFLNVFGGSSLSCFSTK